MTAPLVKVFLASFDRRELLRPAIESVLAQSYANWRLLLFDDGSTDGSAELCRAYAAADPARVEAVLRGENRGLTFSFNEALRGLRENELLAIHAHDDLCRPHRLQVSVDALAARPDASFVASDADLIDETGRPTGERHARRWGAPRAGEDLVERLLATGNCVCATTVTVRGASVRRLSLTVPPAIRLCMDYYSWLALGAVGDVVYLEQPVTSYRVSRGQMSERVGETQREDFLIPLLAWRAHAELRARVSRERVVAATAERGWGYVESARRAGDPRELLWYGVRLMRLHPTPRSLRRLAGAWRGALANRWRARGAHSTGPGRRGGPRAEP